MTTRLSPYEHVQFDALRDWRAQEPGLATWLVGRAAGPMTKSVESMLPEHALRTALDNAQRFALKFCNERALLRRAGVERVEALQDDALEQCDHLARRVRRRAMLAAGSSGALFGIAGTAGLVLDVPSLLVQALRGIHRIGLCYGEPCDSAAAQGRSIAIFALASANSMEEKQAALTALAKQKPHGDDVSWRSGLERAAEREMAKDAAMFGLHNLARSVATHLGWRKAASALPVFGAAIGASVNAWYLHDVASAARYVHQERWLKRRYPKLSLAAQE